MNAEEKRDKLKTLIQEMEADLDTCRKILNRDAADFQQKIEGMRNRKTGPKN